MGKYVDKIIEYKNDNIYVVFYSSSCGYSIKLLNYLKDNSINFKGYDVNIKPNRFTDLLSDLNANSSLIKFNINHRTKPVVFYKGEYVGGADDTIRKLESLIK